MSSVYKMQLWKFQTCIGALLQDWIMCSLHGFPAVPPLGHVSLCEVEGRVYSMPAEEAYVHTFTTAVSIIFFIGIFFIINGFTDHFL
jgi:low affinity Fe/Cu permease